VGIGLQFSIFGPSNLDVWSPGVSWGLLGPPGASWGLLGPPGAVLNPLLIALDPLVLNPLLIAADHGFSNY